MSILLLYLDTSAWLKLYVEEAGADEVRAAVEQAEQVCTHLIAYAELRAALAKAERMSRLNAEQKTKVLPVIERDWQMLNVILPTEMLVKRAGLMADRFGLRGYDCLHLAAAEAISLQVMPQPLVFACFDRDLNESATNLGMQALIPTAWE